MFGFFGKIRDLRRGRYGGFFVENPGTPHERIIKNTIVAQGGTLFLRSLFRGEAVMPTAYYLGLTSATYTFDTGTVTLMAAGEISGNGYARGTLTRNTSLWTVSEVNGVLLAQSAIIPFTASGNWTTSYSRAFLCDSASGTSGNLYAVSGPTPSPRNILSGAGPSVQYNFWLRG